MLFFSTDDGWVVHACAKFQAIARNIVTAKEISHIQKALRKKKHDANYYVTKWQKKVKYADELKAWEKQQEAVLKAQKEQEQLRRNGQV